MFLALFQAGVLGATLRVEGELNCPAPTQVAADVQQISGLSDEYAPRVHATLAREGAFIRLSLTEADGTSLGERLLTADEDCLVLSRTAAVVLAAWLTDQHPEFLVSLPSEPSSAPDSSTPAAAPGDASAAPPSAPALAPAPATPAASEAPQSRVRPAAAPAGRLSQHRLALSAALAGAWSSPAFVPGAWLGVALDPAHAGWGAQISAAWLGERTQPLSRSRVSWSRWPLMLGPYLQVPTRLGSLELEAGPSLAWLHLKGQKFSPDLGVSTVQVGGYGALRFMIKWGAWRPFLMATPQVWFNSVSAAATDSSGAPTDRTELSSFEVLFSAGVRFLP
ncbi:MAG: hypothetical protein ABJB12_17405 [Pseudomonadota bacterium]